MVEALRDYIADPIHGSYLIRETAAVPEPATWAMMLIGFGLVGAQLKRRDV